MIPSLKKKVAFLLFNHFFRIVFLGHFKGSLPYEENIFFSHLKIAEEIRYRRNVLINTQWKWKPVV